MPFWPFLLIACTVLFLWGRDTKHAFDAIMMFTGVLLMRWTNTVDFDLSLFGYEMEPVSFVSFWVWLIITALVAFNKSYLVAFLLGISTIAYLPFVVSNIGITRLGVAAFASDIPLVLAMVACGNGIFGNGIRDNRDSGIVGHWRSLVRLFGRETLAESKAGTSEVIQKDGLKHGR